MPLALHAAAAAATTMPPASPAPAEVPAMVLAGFPQAPVGLLIAANMCILVSKAAMGGLEHWRRWVGGHAPPVACRRWHRHLSSGLQQHFL